MKYIILFSGLLIATLSDAKVEVLTKSAAQLSTDVSKEGTDITKLLDELDKMLDKITGSSGDVVKKEKKVKEVEKAIDDIYGSLFHMNLGKLNSKLTKLKPSYDFTNHEFTDAMIKGLQPQIDAEHSAASTKIYFNKAFNEFFIAFMKFFNADKGKTLMAEIDTSGSGQ
ncbi:MAG TPA: hypothetical protein QGF02_02185 [Candidatus Babeliales bacterium]|nr:hypothetical protein [Candidatus Babeliales bacterium]